jgi:PAS domain S-box-containing protein
MKGKISRTDLLKRIRALDGGSGDAGSTSAWRDLFFDLSIDMLCVIGMDGRFIHVSPAWKRTLGWGEKEFLDKAPLELVHPDDHESTVAMR